MANETIDWAPRVMDDREIQAQRDAYKQYKLLRPEWLKLPKDTRTSDLEDSAHAIGSYIGYGEAVELMTLDIEQHNGTFSPISGTATAVTVLRAAVES